MLFEPCGHERARAETERCTNTYIPVKRSAPSKTPPGGAVSEGSQSEDPAAPRPAQGRLRSQGEVEAPPCASWRNTVRRWHPTRRPGEPVEHRRRWSEEEDLLSNLLDLNLELAEREKEGLQVVGPWDPNTKA